MSAEDAERLALQEGDAVMLRSAAGAYEGRVYLAPVKQGSLQVHWPEANVLLDRSKRAAAAGIPDYNAVVRIEKALK
jgi:anaerobic selenocysteine-containing dehydrogenase